MDQVIDGFTDREFAVDELTTIINVVPNNYGLVTNLGIFPQPDPIATTYVSLERDNYTLNLLPVTERGGPPSVGSSGKRDKKIIEVPQISHKDEVKVADIQNLRAFGSRAPEQLENMVGRKLRTMAQKHFITHEYQRCGALQGRILDADGSTILDIFDEFDITQGVAAFGVNGIDMPKLIRTIKRQIERSLKGELMSGVMCLASPEFMELIWANTGIRDALKEALAGSNPYGNPAPIASASPVLFDNRRHFTLQGVTFVEYAGTVSAKNSDGTEAVRRFIPAGEATFFPWGTQQSAFQWCAPGDFEECVNLPGQLFYAKEKRDGWGRGREIFTQSNLLPIWARPELLIKGTTSTNGGDTTVTDMAA